MKKTFKREAVIFLVAFLLNIILMPIAEARTYWFVTMAQERSAGDQYASQIENQNTVIKGHPYNMIVDEVTAKLVSTIENPRFPYKTVILDDGHLNAYSVPAGHIYITYKMMEAVKTYDEVAFIIGHELGHDMNEHYLQSVERMYKAELTAVILGQALKVDNNIMNVLYVAVPVLQSRGYGFAKENEADKYGFNRAADAGYNVGAGAMFFWYLNKLEKRTGSTDIATKLSNYMNPHPNTMVRLEKQLQYLKQWSGNIVEVKEDSVYINGKFLLKPGPNGKYDSHERTYYIAGNIAREYHDNKAVTWWVNEEGRLMANNKVIFTPVGNDENANEIYARVMR